MGELLDALAGLSRVWSDRHYFAQIGRAIWRRVRRRRGVRLVPAVTVRLRETAAFAVLFAAAMLTIGNSGLLGLTHASRTVLFFSADAAVVGLLVSAARLGSVLPDEEPSRRPFR